MEKKVLSLCFPTYNRDWCIKEQINRLMSLSFDIQNRIEIIISDNCSSDDTECIVKTACANGFQCRYIRNQKNLGMDGNFVNCFRIASGKYIWLLGDDDFIKIEQLEKIVDVLDTTPEIGLLHIDHIRTDSNCGAVKLYDADDMIRNIGYWITFISANIVNGKYVSRINFDKYMGTWFTIMPLYITAIQNEPINIIYYNEVFDAYNDSSSNGGYNYFEVFVVNYLSIWKEFIANKNLIKWIKKDIWPFIFTNTKQLLIQNKKGNFKTKNGICILLKYYGNEWYFWLDWLKYPWGVINRKMRRFMTSLCVKDISNQSDRDVKEI